MVYAAAHAFWNNVTTTLIMLVSFPEMFGRVPSTGSSSFPVSANISPELWT